MAAKSRYDIMPMRAYEYITVQLLLWSTHTRCEYSSGLSHDAALLTYTGGAFLMFLTCNVTYMQRYLHARWLRKSNADCCRDTRNRSPQGHALGYVLRTSSRCVVFAPLRRCKNTGQHKIKTYMIYMYMYMYMYLHVYIIRKTTYFVWV